MTARQWIRALDPDLAVQARLLERLLEAVEPDARWEWLELGCSVAEGRGDALSDLDLALGYADEAPPAHEVTAMLRALSPVIDIADSPWDEVHRWWAQYADGGQIDLIAMPAGARPGRAPGSVALLDRNGRLAETFTPRSWRAGPDEPRQWLVDGWEALANTAKYAQRHSLLEGCEQVARARQRICQLWAVGEGVPYPSFGLTSLLDAAEPNLPPDIESTYPTPTREGVTDAALAAARLLHLAGQHAQQDLDSPLRQYVTERLEVLDRRRRDRPST